MSPPSRFKSSRKPVLIVALTMATILAGSLAVQYYTWSVGYEINPLITIITLSITPTSGATTGWDGIYFCWLDEPAWINVTKDSDVYFMVTETDRQALWDEAFYRLTAYIDIYEYDSGYPVEYLDLRILDGTEPNGDVATFIELFEGTYEITAEIYFDYHTGAVEDTVEGSFSVCIYAVEW